MQLWLQACTVHKRDPFSTIMPLFIWQDSCSESLFGGHLLLHVTWGGMGVLLYKVGKAAKL